MRHNNVVRIDGRLAQETVEVISTRPFLVVRVAVDTAAIEQGGRHWVLFERERAVTLAAYLAAAQSLNAPLSISVTGSLRHEGNRSLLVELNDVSYGAFRSVRLRAEELLKQGVTPHIARGPMYPLAPAGYHSCVYLGGTLDMASLGAREDEHGNIVLFAMLNTGDPGGVGHHELLFPQRQVQEPVLALRQGLPPGTEQAPVTERLARIETNVWGTPQSAQGCTAIIVTRVEFAHAVLRPPLAPG